MKKFLMLLIGLFLFNFLNAELVMFDYTTDPAIITAGDQVDLIVSFKDKPLSKIDYSSYYSYKFELVPDDTLAKKYFTIIDADGDDLAFLDSAKVWNVKFKLRVNSDAKPGKYKLKLIIKKYDSNGNLLTTYSKDVYIEVKKLGSDVVIGTITTDPYEIRVGDDLVNLNIEVSNIGHKLAKGINIELGEIKEVFEHKYATDYKKFVPVLKPFESKHLIYQFEVKENAKPGVYKIPYILYWKDEDDNLYSYRSQIEVKIKGKPIFIVEKSEGTGKIGGEGKLYVYVKNVGYEKAENVRVRIIKDSSIPLSIEDRSLFIGDLAPGESKLAVFNVKVDRFAKEDDYNLKVQITGKGDTDENDDRIYSYYREATFEVKGKAPNKIYYVAAAVGVIALLYVIYLLIKKLKKPSVKTAKN
jgi:hypothetical protein